MMLQTPLLTELLQHLSDDPYAILGIAVTADERSILRRYYVLAKLLHPDQDSRNKGDKELFTAILTRLINPAYAELKNIQKRSDNLANLRAKAITWGKNAVTERNPLLKKFMGMSLQEAQLFYEKAIADYAKIQYQTLNQSALIVQKLNELNLAYLYLQSQPLFNPKDKASQAVIVSPTRNPTVVAKLNKTKNSPASTINYAQRHYQRAIEYSKQSHWSLAVRELRDAIKLEPDNSDYYALLGVIHQKQKFIGMAKVYIRHALKLNPQNPLALKYASQLQIPVQLQTDSVSLAKAIGIAGWLSKFLVKVEAKLSQVLKFR
ncbi:J domain-containing protein [Aliinostoc sp. HNIBRCY26]|uniref:J domain-containing protein n=1 Tax=Aliinostoc sp. HNIBRCY26 TaxID=3418997 RepID=UPI003D07D751